MIIDRIDRLIKYKFILSNIAKAVAKVNELNDWEEGVRYPFEGGFVFFQKTTTRPIDVSQFESHKKYVDVQLVLSGTEYVALGHRSNLSVSIPYSEEKDVEKYDGPTVNYMRIDEGMGYICFPWDIHKAVFHTETEFQVTKAVIKIEI